jgi:hypothetical protein
MPRRAPLDRSWRIRRAIIIGTILWCVGMVTYLSVWGRDTSLSETTVNGCLLLMASVIGSYVFGAVWDDRNRDQARYEYEPPYQREVYRERVAVPAQQADVEPEPPPGYAP